MPTQSLTHTASEDAAAELARLHDLVQTDNRIRAQREEELNRALAAMGGENAALADIDSISADVSRLHHALALADRALHSYRKRARQLMPVVAAEADQRAREAKAILHEAFDLVVERTRARVQKLCGAGLFPADAESRLLAQTQPVAREAAFLQENTMGNPLRFEFISGEIVLAADNSVPAVLFFHRRASETLALAQEHLAEVKGQKD